jgi:hypothetical protein
LLTYATAAVYTLLGLPLFVAPNWAAENFLWKVTPFLVMTIGAWYLGAAFTAWRSARVWRWSLVQPAMIFLWCFGLLETILLVVFRGTLQLNQPLAWPYIVALVFGSISAIIGIVDWITTRPTGLQEGAPILLWQRFLFLLFVIFAGFISIPLLTGAARGGTIWPGELSPLSARGFGAFYFAITLAGLAGLFARYLPGVQFVMPYSIAGAVLLTIPALVFIDRFDFQAQPGGLVYIGTYIAVIIVALPIYFGVGARRARATEVSL